MRAAFLLLLLANIALLAWQQGLLGATVEAGREPERVARQIAAETIRVLAPGELAALRGTATATAAGEGNAGLACVELGDFDDASLARIQSRLAALALGDRLRAKRASAAGWFIVYLPPLATRAEAERVAQELRGRGIRDLVVMGPNAPMPNAIVLGSFRDPELAQRHQADLARRGVVGAQTSQRGAGAETTRFEIRGVDAVLAQQLAEIQKEFPQSQLGACAN
jgi:hypothetical protein